jgi:hypothetical protein
LPLHAAIPGDDERKEDTGNGGCSSSLFFIGRLSKSLLIFPFLKGEDSLFLKILVI